MAALTQLRTLNFQSLDEILADIQNLHERGYEQGGKWNLAQICGHLKSWMVFADIGYPKAPFGMGLIRVLLGKRIIRQVLSSRKMRNGSPTLAQTVFSSSPVKTPEEQRQNDQAEIANFVAAVTSFRNHTGEYHFSPLFGQLSREQMNQLQLIHCSHHLSFLKAKSSS